MASQEPDPSHTHTRLESTDGDRPASLLEGISEIRDLDMYELGELYVSIIFHSVNRSSGDPVVTSTINDAIDTYFELLTEEGEDGLRDVLSGINEGLHHVAEGHAIRLNVPDGADED